ncbi:hypothetical protein D9756_006733 [Leucocoprinus leucothites]|uniref:Uncharacterized protein n=1 Tax=Leucocoprinus leucothites TaxID=201217 RepID=A0A8H5G2H2_9AGAR|nr:hypothetical protein D9756_006733 [Leucoagaricus leucothites]
MLVLSTIELAFSSHFEQVAYIDFQGRFSGTPLVAQTVYTRKHIALSAVLLVASILLDMISLGVLVWRCWIIWRMTRYSFLVIILPLVLLIVRFALLIVVLARNLVPDLYPGVVMDILLLVTMGLDTTITMIVTTPIVRRLLIVRRRHIRIMGSASEHASPYYSIITMFVESYALESAWSLGSIISRATLEAGDPAILFFAPTGDSVKSPIEFRQGKPGHQKRNANLVVYGGIAAKGLGLMNKVEDLKPELYELASLIMRPRITHRPRTCV